MTSTVRPGGLHDAKTLMIPHRTYSESSDFPQFPAFGLSSFPGDVENGIDAPVTAAYNHGLIDQNMLML